MVRKRGGGTGQGQGHGQGQDQRGKRQATTPVGAVYKDSRRNIQGDEDFDDDEEWTQVTRNKQKSPVRSGSGSGMQEPNQPDIEDNQSHDNVSSVRPSFASVAGQGLSSQSMHTRRDSTTSAAAAGIREKKTLDRIFRTPDPDGPMRDDIIVEVQTVNDLPFKGSLTFTEAKDGVFNGCLGLNIKLIHGIRFAFSTYPVVKFKLKQQIDVDMNLQHVEFFNFERRYSVKGVEKTDVLGCRVRGLRTANNERSGQYQEPDPDPNVRWVKIEWVDYGIEETQILEWLNYFGEQAGQLSEEIHPNSDSDADPIGNGTFSIKMRLRTDIPQLLPMWGKRVRIYHRGVQKLCSNCFGLHQRRNCRSEKVAWTRYVLNFMEKHPEIPSEMYGRWWKVINDEFGTIIEEDENEVSVAQGPDAPQRNAENIQTSRPSNTQERPQPKQTELIVKTRLTREEENNLADYLSLGMSINDARNAFQVELEAAELRLKVRENQRARRAGSIQVANRARPGSTVSGRGGLSFN